MKGQSRIDFRARKNASNVNADIPKNKKIIEESEHCERAFRPMKEIPFEPVKVEKAKPTPRKSGRLATKNLKQTVLILKSDTPTSEKESDISKRKLNESKKSTTKKQKTTHDRSSSIEATRPSPNEVLGTKNIEENNKATVSTGEKDVSTETIEPIIKEKEALTETVQEITKENKVSTQTIVDEETLSKEHVEHITKEVVVTEQVETLIKPDTANETVIEETLSLDQKETVDSPLLHSQPEDSPTPPSALSLFTDEPATPPTLNVAPYKEYLTPADKQRIMYEKTTLQKVRKALDIVITDRAARNRPTLYHQIEPVLRNSTQRTITLSHICKIMYLAPSLYTLQAKELRNFGGKVTEAFLIEFGKDWIVPLNGKDLQKRADLLIQSAEDYFDTHRQPDASVPEIPLPRLALVVDKKEWIKDAKLPPGVRSLLQAHEKAKQADEEKEKPKPKPTGTVKDRMAALRARLAEKKAS